MDLGKLAPAFLADAWRCESCDELMYNVEVVAGVRTPTSGAPLPHFVNGQYKKVCTLCHWLLRA